MKPSLYILQKKSDLSDEKVATAIERIDRNITRCDHIIDELLDFTRINDLDLMSTKLDDWLFNLVNELPIHPDIKLNCEPGVNDMELNLDQERLRRAIINVVDNGVQAMLNEPE